VPWEAVAGARKVRRPRDSSRALQLDRSDAGVVANVVVLSQTNVDIVLDRPTTVSLRGDATETVIAVRCYADDPDALVAHVRAHVATR
jgi:hypothetical protein